MDGTDVVAAVREAVATELDRLGSAKALVAATGANLDEEAVLEAAAESEALARDTFVAWSEQESNATAREAFERLADEEGGHYERIVAWLDSPPDAPASDPLHDHLRGVDGTVDRVGAGLVGRPLAASQSLLQFVSFYVNEASEDRADLFRDLRSDTDRSVERGATLLDEVCESEADYERARDAAVETIEVAYAAYADRLEAMGVDPKPIC